MQPRSLTERFRQRNLRQKMLTEGISHIEALPPDAFLDAIEHIGRFVATEKLDGYNFWFGFDESGKFYTCRGGKGSDHKFYSDKEFPLHAAMNGFRAAHQALEKQQAVLKSVVESGEIVEIEVLFGKQPNAIVYGDNMIAFIRFVKSNHDGEADPERIKSLAKLLHGKVCDTVTTDVLTDDGETLEQQTRKHQWKFVSVPFIDKSIISSVDLSKEIAAVRAFLNAPSDKLSELTNKQIITVNLTSIPTDVRELARQERERVSDEFMTKYKQPIKAKLVKDLLSNAKPKLQTVKVPPSEDLGIEGIVFLNPQTNEQFKLVNKDLFTAINTFNFVVRSAVRSTRNMEPAAKTVFHITDSDLSVFDEVIRDIGAALKISSSLRYFTARSVLSKYGSTPQEIIAGVAAQVSDFDQVKQAVETAIARGLQHLQEMLQRFKANWKKYTLKTPNGKSFHYNETIYNRTLVTFAEVEQDLKELQTKVSAVSSASQLVAVVFSKQLTARAK